MLSTDVNNNNESDSSSPLILPTFKALNFASTSEGSEAQREAATIQNALAICQERIDFHESCLDFVDAPTQEQSLNNFAILLKEHYGVGKEIYSSKTHLTQKFPIIISDFKERSYKYQIIKRLLINSINEALLVDFIYDVFCFLFGPEGHKDLHARLKPHLSQAHQACAQYYTNLWDKTASFLELQKKTVEYAKPFLTMLDGFEMMLERYKDVIPELIKYHLQEKTKNLKSSLDETLSNIHASWPPSRFKLLTITSSNKLEDLEASFNLRKELKKDFHSLYLIGTLITEQRDSILRLIKIVGELNKKQKTIETVIPTEQVNLKPQPNDKKLTDKEIIEKNRQYNTLEKEIIAFKKQKEEELRVFKEQIEKNRVAKEQKRAEKNRELIERAKLLNEFLTDFVNESSESKEPTEIEIQQLQFLSTRMKNHFGTLEKIFKKINLKFPELNHLISAIGGELNFKVSSHFEILLPNSYKIWEKREDGYNILNKQMLRKVSWYPHGEAHNNEELSPYAAKRCYKVFHEAGITPDRLKLLAPVLRPTVSGKPKRA